jgi:hypothetical protein
VGHDIDSTYQKAVDTLQTIIDKAGVTQKEQKAFEVAYDAAWDKLDDDLFNTARLITCGMFIQVSIHDYLRALMVSFVFVRLLLFPTQANKVY